MTWRVRDVAAVCTLTRRVRYHLYLSINTYSSSSRRKISPRVRPCEDLTARAVSDSINMQAHISRALLRLTAGIPAFNTFDRNSFCLTSWTCIAKKFSSGKCKQVHIVLFMEFILTSLHYRDTSLNQLSQSEEQSSIPVYTLCTMRYLY